MRLLKFLSSLAISLLLAAMPLHAQSADITESLPAAMANGHVVVGFRSTGASSGDAILLNIGKTSIAPNRLIITIPPGLGLNNVSQTGQSMVLASVRGRALGSGSFVPKNAIVLSDLGTSTYVLSAYCAEFHKDNPAPTSVFGIGITDIGLGCILSTAARNNLSVEATQAAVWRYTDNVSPQEVNRKFSVSVSDWSAAQSVLSSCIPQNEQLGTPMRSITPQASGSASPAGNPTGEVWTEKFAVDFGATLYVSPNSVRYEGRVDKKGRKDKYKPDWSVSCAEMSEWKMLSNGFNKAMLCSDCSAAVQIKLKNGKKMWWYIGTVGDVAPARAVVSAISRACGVNP